MFLSVVGHGSELCYGTEKLFSEFLCSGKIDTRFGGFLTLGRVE